MALSLLPLVADDLPFVREMLHAAAFWRGDTDPPAVDEALHDPALATYVAGWGRPGDTGLIARVDGVRVGAVWVRRFRDDAHGYGYVDERTPELSLAVVAGHRGRGLGRCLLTAMLTELRLAGIGQVSLSVETDNPARGLYEDLRFEPRATVDGAVTMVRELLDRDPAVATGG
jgi:ribosomal protein S18 acetylase RimI-like enzyme